MYFRNAIFIIFSALLFAGCSSDSDNSEFFADATPILTILVTNDDGIGAPGINSLVNNLAAVADAEVVLVAPAESQSGTSDMTTAGDVVFQDSATTSGYSGTAVFGFPSDSVTVALGELGITPHLVVSGVNSGQNVGPAARFSGTIGAAQTAARAGFPAVATSAGQPADTDFSSAAQLVVDWIEENREALLSRTANTSTITNFNIPYCTAGSIRGLVEVPLAEAITDGVNHTLTDCSVDPAGDPVSDIDALIQGFASVTQLPLDF